MYLMADMIYVYAEALLLVINLLSYLYKRDHLTLCLQMFASTLVNTMNYRKSKLV